LAIGYGCGARGSRRSRAGVGRGRGGEGGERSTSSRQSWRLGAKRSSSTDCGTLASRRNSITNSHALLMPIAHRASSLRTRSTLASSEVRSGWARRVRSRRSDISSRCSYRASVRCRVRSGVPDCTRRPVTGHWALNAHLLPAFVKRKVHSCAAQDRSKSHPAAIARFCHRVSYSCQ
jgi:hypothetical protein